MIRGAKSSLAALGACLAALTLLAPATAGAAAPAAGEAYILRAPGVFIPEGGADPVVTSSQKAGPVGVLGERDGSVTALGALGDALTTPGGIGLLVAIAAGLAIVFSPRPGRRE